jgi:hypothetical protein
MKLVLLCLLIFLSSPALAGACPDFRGLYFRNDSTGQYQIRVNQDECESVSMIIQWGPYGSNLPFREFTRRPSSLSSLTGNALGMDSVSAALLPDSLFLLRTSGTPVPGGVSLSRVAEVYRKTPTGGIFVEIDQLNEELPSTQKWEQNSIQIWTRIGN